MISAPDLSEALGVVRGLLDVVALLDALAVLDRGDVDNLGGRVLQPGDRSAKLTNTSKGEIV